MAEARDSALEIQKDCGVAKYPYISWSIDEQTVTQISIPCRVLVLGPVVLGRAFTAIQVQNGTVHVARGYALQIIHLEKDLRIFWELQIQGFFLQQSFLMIWINRIYSFIHIPGTILFLIWLYYYTTTRNEVFERQVNEGTQIRLGYRIGKGLIAGSPKGPLLYEARRRTMGMCNLLAFVISTIWPCMPPRLLSDKSYKGSMGNEASSYNFVDTVYGIGGESIVWKENKFSTQYAAMPSLHFGYALMIGLTIIMIPLPHHHRRSKSIPVSWINPFRAVAQYHIDFPPWRRMLCITVGVFTILIAVLATANHFILDALVGALVCGLGWWTNMILLNLVPLEDYFLWCLRVYKPEGEIIPVLEGYDKEDLLVEKAVVPRG
ncbi:MAG: hypothetical protein M1827_004311 [Pycnora praestabilis]|nr:MAG: hypothetical protein M1827_004311 [Pycnora praestabilis]